MYEETMERTEELDPEEKKAQLRLYEKDILGGLLAAAGYRDCEEETYPVEIVRNGAVVLSFHVRPLSEAEYETAKNKNSKFKRNKTLDIKIIEKTDTVRYRSELIYTATVQADRDAIWDNKEAWRQLGVLNGVDLVSVVLKAGEKAAVLELIEKISGYGIELEETVKN